MAVIKIEAYVHDVPLSTNATALLLGAPGTEVEGVKAVPFVNSASTRTVHLFGEETGHVDIGALLATAAYAGSYSPFRTIRLGNLEFETHRWQSSLRRHLLVQDFFGGQWR